MIWTHSNLVIVDLESGVSLCTPIFDKIKVVIDEAMIVEIN